MEKEARHLQQTVQWRKTIRQADALDRKWAVENVVLVLGLATTTRNPVVGHFRWQKVRRINLRELMVCVISDAQHPKPGYVISPLLDFRCLGKDGFWCVVHELTATELSLAPQVREFED